MDFLKISESGTQSLSLRVGKNLINQTMPSSRELLLQHPQQASSHCEGKYENINHIQKYTSLLHITYI